MSSSTLKNCHNNLQSCLHSEINILLTFVLLHCYFWWENWRIQSASARWRNSMFQRWLFWTPLIGPCISSTESCVIGYNAQCFKNVCVSGSVPASEADLNLIAGDVFIFFRYSLQDKLRISPKIVCCDMILNLGGLNLAPPPRTAPASRNKRAFLC